MSKYYRKRRVKYHDDKNPYGISHDNPYDVIYKVVGNEVWIYNFIKNRFVGCGNSLDYLSKSSHLITKQELEDVLTKEIVVRELSR